MPNWCSNRLAVYGPDEDVARFKDKAAGNSPWHAADGEKNVLNFHSLVPILPEILAAGYEAAGYSWELKNWGCKWGACSAHLADEWEGRLEYAFETPWSPPIPFLTKAALDWPTLTFLLDYEEMGMGFKGITKIQGENIEDHCLYL
jgi:Ferredoxin-like domain in Api92-like protein